MTAITSWRLVWGSGSYNKTAKTVTADSKQPVADGLRPTYSALLTSGLDRGDGTLKATLRTTKQHRPTPNAWECAWLMWRRKTTQTDGQGQCYYLVLKPETGWEVGKSFPNEGQVFLATGAGKFPIGTPYAVEVKQIGSLITITVNGKQLCQVTDPTPLEPGRVGCYVEDAAAVFSGLSWQSLS